MEVPNALPCNQPLLLTAPLPVEVRANNTIINNWEQSPQTWQSAHHLCYALMAEFSKRMLNSINKAEWRVYASDSQGKLLPLDEMFTKQVAGLQTMTKILIERTITPGVGTMVGSPGLALPTSSSSNLQNINHVGSITATSTITATPAYVAAIDNAQTRVFGHNNSALRSAGQIFSTNPGFNLPPLDVSIPTPIEERTAAGRVPRTSQKASTFIRRQDVATAASGARRSRQKAKLQSVEKPTGVGVEATVFLNPHPRSTQDSFNFRASTSSFSIKPRVTSASEIMAEMVMKLRLGFVHNLPSLLRQDYDMEKAFSEGGSLAQRFRREAQDLAYQYIDTSNLVIFQSQAQRLKDCNYLPSGSIIDSLSESWNASHIPRFTNLQRGQKTEEDWPIYRMYLGFISPNFGEELRALAVRYEELCREPRRSQSPIGSSRLSTSSRRSRSPHFPSSSTQPPARPYPMITNRRTSSNFTSDTDSVIDREFTFPRSRHVSLSSRVDEPIETMEPILIPELAQVPDDFHNADLITDSPWMLEIDHSVQAGGMVANNFLEPTASHFISLSPFGAVEGNSEDDLYDHEELLQPFVPAENIVLRDFLDQEQATEVFRTSTEFGRIVGICVDVKEQLNLLKPARVRKAQSISVKLADDIADLADSFCSQVFIEIGDDPKLAGIMYSGSTVRVTPLVTAYKAVDAGGPTRSVIGATFEEFTTKALEGLPLFEKTYGDTFIPCAFPYDLVPDGPTEAQLRIYKFIGWLFVFSLVHNSHLLKLNPCLLSTCMLATTDATGTIDWSLLDPNIHQILSSRGTLTWTNLPSAHKSAIMSILREAPTHFEIHRLPRALEDKWKQARRHALKAMSEGMQLWSSFQPVRDFLDKEKGAISQLLVYKPTPADLADFTLHFTSRTPFPLQQEFETALRSHIRDEWTQDQVEDFLQWVCGSRAYQGKVGVFWEDKKLRLAALELQWEESSKVHRYAHIVDQYPGGMDNAECVNAVNKAFDEGKRLAKRDENAPKTNTCSRRLILGRNFENPADLLNCWDAYMTGFGKQGVLSFNAK
ncbi:hypothetical protein DFS34DRAFT_641553 [Phlyctochytrium arcticum]|nr:hypothetical protein DFS34DRAFT_641553 [Phlyctochytrium arcticum]